MEQYFTRKNDRYLAEWKDDKYRKPLLIRGARQIGKSSAARNFGKTFKYFPIYAISNFAENLHI